MGGWLFFLYSEDAKAKREKADQQKQEEAEELKKHLRKDGKPRFDRVGYMREYMRGRRAKVKEVHHTGPTDGT